MHLDVVVIQDSHFSTRVLRLELCILVIAEENSWVEQTVYRNPATNLVRREKSVFAITPLANVLQLGEIQERTAGMNPPMLLRHLAHAHASVLPGPAEGHDEPARARLEDVQVHLDVAGLGELQHDLVARPGDPAHRQRGQHAGVLPRGLRGPAALLHSQPLRHDAARQRAQPLRTRRAAADEGPAGARRETAVRPRRHEGAAAGAEEAHGPPEGSATAALAREAN
mmetsp:Transcript_41573/g.115999  ORF Transcript_41573/g.115999 Transcript_41573/m.115999 type:complete len:226 (-) Transcript_41573:3-680(-)